MSISGKKLKELHHEYLSKGGKKQKTYSPILRMAVINCIRGEGANIPDISSLTGAAPAVVKNIVLSLSEAGYVLEQQGDFVKLLGGIPEYQMFRIPPKLLKGKIYEFGIVSDCHLGSHTERLDVLNAAYDDFKRSGIDTVYLPGNMVEGEGRVNKYDIRVHGITDQTLYCLDHFPQRSGITTYFITADDHEGWWFQREGIDWGRYLMLEARDRGRDDLVHIGYQEADVEIKTSKGRAVIRLLHPGGGMAYATSYPLQKIVESLQGGEKPHIILCGHYHKGGKFYPREVHSQLCATTADQSRFMRKNKLQANVGYTKVRLMLAFNGGVLEYTETFMPFYDRKCYIKRTV